MKELEEYAWGVLLHHEDFDSLAFASIDFKKGSYESFECSAFGQKLFYDLASLTKPLTLSPYFLEDSKRLDKELSLLLNHRAGLPSWARLSQKDWKELVLSYPIKESKTEYSDLSALRLMLEIEKKEKKPLFQICSPYFDSDLCFWKELPEDAMSPFTGYRQNAIISGVVHDDNAFVLDQFCSHAGLFSTIDGIARTLLNFEKKLNLISLMRPLVEKSKDRFVLGFDTARDDEGLAGRGHSPLTFGHLGFTGTSFWIDPESLKGVVLLTNATQKYWYNRENLNSLRRELSSRVWSA